MKKKNLIIKDVIRIKIKMFVNFLEETPNSIIMLVMDVLK